MSLPLTISLIRLSQVVKYLQYPAEIDGDMQCKLQTHGYRQIKYTRGSWRVFWKKTKVNWQKSFVSSWTTNDGGLKQSSFRLVNLALFLSLYSSRSFERQLKDIFPGKSYDIFYVENSYISLIYRWYGDKRTIDLPMFVKFKIYFLW